jgi:hypothetical protein
VRSSASRTAGAGTSSRASVRAKTSARGMPSTLSEERALNLLHRARSNFGGAKTAMAHESRMPTQRCRADSRKQPISRPRSADGTERLRLTTFKRAGNPAQSPVDLREPWAPRAGNAPASRFDPRRAAAIQDFEPRGDRENSARPEALDVRFRIAACLLRAIPANGGSKLSPARPSGARRRCWRSLRVQTITQQPGRYSRSSPRALSAIAALTRQVRGAFG